MKNRLYAVTDIFTLKLNCYVMLALGEHNFFRHTTDINYASQAHLDLVEVLQSEDIACGGIFEEARDSMII